MMLFRNSRRPLNNNVDTKNGDPHNAETMRKTLSLNTEDGRSTLADSSTTSFSTAHAQESFNSTTQDSRKRRFPKLRLAPWSSRNLTASVEDKQGGAAPSTNGSASRRWLSLSCRRGRVISNDASSPSPKPQLQKMRGQRRLAVDDDAAAQPAPLSASETAPLRDQPLKERPTLTRPPQFRPMWMKLPKTAIEDGFTLTEFLGKDFDKKNNFYLNESSPSPRGQTPRLGSSWFPSNHVRVNLLREKCDLHRLYRNRQLDAIARVHAEQMMIRGEAFGVDMALLKDTIEQNFGNGCLEVACLGENNFLGNSLSEIATEMMQDVTQTENLFSSNYTHMGMGTARARDGTVYLCQLFMGF